MYKRGGPRGDKYAPKGSKDHFPAVSIDQIAVTGPRQREGIGTYILLWILRLVDAKISPLLGCRYIAADAYDEESNHNFFLKAGFFPVPDDWMRSKDQVPRKNGARRIKMIYDLKGKPY